MNNEFRRKIDDHHLLLEVYRLAEKLCRVNGEVSIANG